MFQQHEPGPDTSMQTLNLAHLQRLQHLNANFSHISFASN